MINTNLSGAYPNFYPASHLPTVSDILKIAMKIKPYQAPLKSLLSIVCMKWKSVCRDVPGKTIKVMKKTDVIAVKNSHAIKKLLLTIIKNATNYETCGYELLLTPSTNELVFGVLLLS